MSKLAYPKGRLLLVRDCTVDICLKNNPGAVLLSVLLFWYDNPHKGDFYNPDEGTFTVCRTQEDIEQQSCNQIDVKTIHDVAVPFLQLFGFLDIKEKMFGNLYTLDIRHVEDAYEALGKDAEYLKGFLLSSLQLEKFLIELTEDELEKTLIDKKFLFLQLEKVLIRNREISNCKRGRKPRSEAPLVTDFRNIEIIRDSIEIDTKREGGAFASLSPLPSEDDFSEEDEVAPTVKMPAIKLNGASHANTVVPTDLHSGFDRGDTPDIRGSVPDRPVEQTPGTPALPSAIEPPQLGRSHGIRSVQATSAREAQYTPTAQGSHEHHDAAATPDQSEPRASGERAKPEKPKRGRKQEVQLTLAEAQLKEWLEEVRETEITLTKRTVAALRSLAVKKGSDNKEMFLTIVAVLDSDTWFEEHKIGVDFYWIDRQWENKYIFLQRKKPALADKKKPVNWVPADDDYSLAALAQIQANRQGV